jgi:hypothetical protein
MSRKTSAMRALTTRATPWFGVAIVVLGVDVAFLHRTAGDVLFAVGFMIFLGACIRAVVLAVRDDDVSSATLRSPAERTLGIMGAESAGARRRRRHKREGRDV